MYTVLNYIWPFEGNLKADVAPGEMSLNLCSSPFLATPTFSPVGKQSDLFK